MARLSALILYRSGSGLAERHPKRSLQGNPFYIQTRWADGAATPDVAAATHHNLCAEPLPLRRGFGWSRRRLADRIAQDIDAASNAFLTSDQALSHEGAITDANFRSA